MICALVMVLMLTCGLAWGGMETTPWPALVLMPPPAPTSLLTITQPADRSIVQPKATVPVIVDATEFSGITRLTVSVDGPSASSSQQLCVKFAPPFACDWKVPAGANQTYTISAQAMDGTGKNTLTQIQVLAK